MCGSPAGTRCASDTREACEKGVAAWNEANPGVLDVNPVASAEATPFRERIPASRLRPGDRIGAEKVVHAYRGVRTPTGRLKVRLAGTNPKTGEARVRDVEWGASTKLSVTRESGPSPVVSG